MLLFAYVRGIIALVRGIHLMLRWNVLLWVSRNLIAAYVTEILERQQKRHVHQIIVANSSRTLSAFTLLITGKIELSFLRGKNVQNIFFRDQSKF